MMSSSKPIDTYKTLSTKYGFSNIDLRYRDSSENLAPPLFNGNCTLCSKPNTRCVCDVDVTNQMLWISRNAYSDWSSINNQRRKQDVLNKAHIFIYENAYYLSVLRIGFNKYVIFFNPHDINNANNLRQLLCVPNSYTYYFYDTQSFNITDAVRAVKLHYSEIGRTDIRWDCDLDDCTPDDLFNYMRSVNKGSYKPAKKWISPPPAINQLHELVKKEQYVDDGVVKDLPTDIYDFFVEKKRINPQFYPDYERRFANLTLLEACKTLFFSHIPTHHDKGLMHSIKRKKHGIRFETNSLMIYNHDVKDLFNACVATHYKKNGHHPEHHTTTMTVQDTIEAMIDYWVSAMRLTTSPIEAIKIFRTWILDIKKNEYGVYTDIQVRPKFDKLNPAGVLLFMHHLLVVGVTSGQKTEFMAAAVKRKLPLTNLGFTLVNDPSLILDATVKRKRELYKDWDEMHWNFDDTLLHVWGVDTILNDFLLPSGHDSDKFNFDMMAIYALRWNCMTPQGEIKEFTQGPDFKSDIPDFPKNSPSTGSFFTKFGNKMKKSIATYVKDDVLEGIVSQAKVTLEQMIKIFGNMSTIMDKFKECFQPLLKFFNIALRSQDIDTETVVSLLGCWLAFVNTTNPVLRTGVIVIAASKLGIFEKLMEAIKTVTKFLGLDFVFDMGDYKQPQFCSDSHPGLMEFFKKIFDPENSQYAGWLVAFLVTLICGYKSFDPSFVKNQGGALMSVFKNLHFIGAGIFGLSRITNWITAGVKVALDFIREHVFKTEPKDVEKKRLAREFQDSVALWVGVVNALSISHSTMIITKSLMMRKKIKDLYAQGIAFESKILREEEVQNSERIYPTILLHEIKDKLRLLKPLFDSVTRLESNGKMRPVPFHIQFYGDPGVGKSFLHYRMVSEIHRRFYHSYDRQYIDYCDPGPSVEFKNGYAGQKIYRFDEAWPINDAAKITEFLIMMSNAPLNVPMAHLDQKETHFESEWIISNTNTAHPEVTGLYCREALYRRRDLLVKVEIDQYVTGTDKTFDMGKFKERYPGMNANDFPHLRFSLINPMDKACNPEKQTGYEEELKKSGVPAPMVDLTFPEFVQRVFARREHSRAEQDKKFQNNEDPYVFTKELLSELKKVFRDTQQHPTGRMFQTNFEQQFKMFEDSEDFTYDEVFDTYEHIEEIIKDLKNDKESLPEVFNRYTALLKDPEKKILYETISMDLTKMLIEAALAIDNQKDFDWYYTYWILNLMVKFGDCRTDLLNFHEKLTDPDCTQKDFIEFMKTFSEPKYQSMFGTFPTQLSPLIDPIPFCKEGVKKIKDKTLKKKNAQCVMAAFYIQSIIDGYDNTESFTKEEIDILSDEAPNFCAQWTDEEFEDDYVSFQAYVTAIGQCAQLTTEVKEHRNEKLTKLLNNFCDKFFGNPDSLVSNSNKVLYGRKVLHLLMHYENDPECKDFCYALVLILEFIHDSIGEQNFKILIMFDRENKELPFTTFLAFKTRYPDPYDLRWWNTDDEYKRRKAGRPAPAASEYRTRFHFDFSFGENIFGTEFFDYKGRTIIKIPNFCNVVRTDFKNLKLGALSDYCIKLNERSAAKMNAFGLIGTKLSYAFLMCLVRNDMTDEWGFDAELIQDFVNESGLTVAQFISAFTVAGEIEAFSRMPDCLQEWFYDQAYYMRSTIMFCFRLRKKIIEYRDRCYATVIDSVRMSSSFLLNHFKEFKKVYISVIITVGLTWGLSQLGSFFSPSFKSSVPIKHSNHNGMPSFKNSLDPEFLQSHKKMFLFSSINGQNFHSIRVCGKILMCPLHAVRQLLNSKEKTFQFSYRPTHKKPDFWTTTGYTKFVYKIPNCDAVLIYLRDIAPAGNNVDKFWSLEQLEKFQLPEQLGVAYYDTNSIDKTIINTQVLGTINSKVEKIPGLDEGVQYFNIHCRGYFVNGSSGAPVIGLNPFVDERHRIFGVVSCQWQGNAIVSVVPRDILQKSVMELSTVTENIIFEEPCFCTEQTPNSAVDVEGHIEVIGKVVPEMQVSSPSKTAFMPSPISHLLPSSSRRPAQLRPTAEIPSPMKHSLNKYGRDVMRPLDFDLLNEAKGGIARYLENMVRKHRNTRGYALRVLDREEAIFGYDNPYFKPLDWGTSPGLPYSMLKIPGKKPGKNSFFDPERKWIHPLVTEEYDDILEKLKNGIVKSHLMYDFKKDELRPIEKVREGKTRIVTVNNVNWGIIYRQYFGDLETVLRQDSDGSSMYLPGCDIFSMHGYNMYATMFRDRPNCFFLDVGNWDGHMTPQLVNSVVDVVNLIYDKFSNVNEEHEDDWLVREGLANQTLFAYVQYDDMVYRKWAGITSGFGGTTFFNTIAHMILFYYFYLEVMKENRMIADMNFNTYQFNVQARFCGDDLLTGVSDKTIRIFNGVTVAAKYQYYGWPVTNGSDKTKPVEERVHPRDGVILKTKPHAWESLDDVILYVLEEEVCWDMLKWIRKTENGRQQFYMNCLIALEFMCRRGPRVYDSFSDTLDRCLRTINFTPIGLTYEEMSRRLRASLYKSILAHPINTLQKVPVEPMDHDGDELTLMETVKSIKLELGTTGQHLNLTQNHEIINKDVDPAEKQPSSSRIPSQKPLFIRRMDSVLNKIMNEPDWTDAFIRP